MVGPADLEPEPARAGMSAGAARRVAHGLWLVTAALWVVGLTITLLDAPGTVARIALVGVPIAIYASVGALVARASPRNPIGWLFCAVGLALASWVTGLAYAATGLSDGSGVGTLPAAATAGWIAVVALAALLPVALPVFLLFFPDGHLRSRRWRPVLWAVCFGGGLLVLGALGSAWDLDPVSLDPPTWATETAVFEVAYNAGLVAVLATAFAGMLALALRFREASAERRQPLRLLFAMLVAMAVTTAAAIVTLVLTGGQEWWWIAIIVALLVDTFGVFVGIPLATAAAVLTFGLYDVGVVMKKTVVYVLLVIFFLLLVGFTSLILNPTTVVGSAADPRVARIITMVAVLVAILVIAFRPVKRLARRIVYGRRSTPYEAMAEFSERLGDAYATDDVLPRMASIVRASTGAAVARVWLHVGRELRPVASAPADAAEVPSVPVAGSDPPVIKGLRAFPVRDRGELLGALSVEMPAAEPLSKTGERLVSDLAGQAGLVLRNVRLVEELQESRRRIVAAQDERARKLERDLHDGAQQQLVSLSVKLGLAEQLSARDPEKARALMAELKTDANDALGNLRDLARGIYPPLLADKGLEAALEAQARKSSVAVRVEAEACGRYPQEVESAVYFSVLESLQNVAKYANAISVRVSLAQRDGHLTFEIADDGEGFDPAEARGSGLTNMRDRVEALGGTLEVRSRPGEGTEISGSIPVEAAP